MTLGRHDNESDSDLPLPSREPTSPLGSQRYTIRRGDSTSPRLSTLPILRNHTPPSSVLSSLSAPSTSPSTTTKSLDSQSFFLSLPDELLLQILDDLAIRYLHDISLVCRRLHFLVFPLYFTRLGFSRQCLEADGELVISPAMVPFVSTLRSLHFTSLKGFEYSFRLLEIGHERSILRDIRMLDTFLTQLTSVESVTLDFTNVGLFIYSNDQIKRGWSSHLGFLLNTIVGKSCRSFKVLGGVSADFSAHRQSPPQSYRSITTARDSDPSSKATHNLLGALKKLALTITHPQHSDQPKRQRGEEVLQDHRAIRVQYPASRDIALQQLYLHSALFFVYPCYSWTVGIINAAPITLLSFCGWGLPTELWAKLFSELNAPSLSELRLTQSALCLMGLIKFLNRHPNITTLHLDQVLDDKENSLILSLYPVHDLSSSPPSTLNSSFSPSIKTIRARSTSRGATDATRMRPLSPNGTHDLPKYPPLKLPHLEHLSIDTQGLIIFHHLFQTPLALTSLTLLVHIPVGQQFSLNHFDKIIFSQKYTSWILKHVQTLGLCINLKLGSTLDWLYADPSLFRYASSHPKPIPSRATTHQVSPQTTRPNPDLANPTPLFHKTTQLKVTSRFVYATTPPTWLSLFPHLERLLFRRCTEPRMDHASFVSQIMDTCPKTQIVEIDKRVFDRNNNNGNRTASSSAHD